MIGKWFNLLQPAAYADPIQNQAEIESNYKYWRIRTCYSLFFGYAIFYFTRKSFTFAAPVMAKELSLSLAEVGMLGSILYITYGISKFLSGVMSDRSNPRYFMAFALMVTGLCNILFGMSSSLWMFAIFWGLNGWFQAWGWPACCKSLTYWFKKSERGLWYSVTSTSHNVGGALIALLAGYLATQYSWRMAMFIPALISIAMGFVLINRLRDIPESLGLPPVENRYEPLAVVPKKQSLLSAKEIMFKHVLNNKFVWLFALSYFFVYVVRTIINDWTVFFLTDEKGFEAIQAGYAVSGFEIGGLFGMLIAGWGSDYFFKGNRVPAMVISSLGLIGSVIGLWYMPGNHLYVHVTFITLIGFFVFGPQMIVGLAAAEFVDKRAAAASNGFTGTLGYFGAACACGPIGKAVDLWGWGSFYAALIVCSCIIFVLLLPFWSVKEPGRQTALPPKAAVSG